MEQSTPESSPSIFKDRADKIINLLNQTGSDLESSIIVNNDYPGNAEFWTYDEVLDSSIMDRAAANDTTIEEVQEKEQPASLEDVGRDTEQQSGNIQRSPATDANPQSKRGRGRPRKVAPANGIIIKKVKKVPENEESHSASSKDVGRDTEQQSGNIQESPATDANHSFWNHLASFEDFERFAKDNSFGYSDLRLLYESAATLKIILPTLDVLSLLKGPLMFPTEVCQKKIQTMETILNNKIKKRFYYTIEREGELWERKEMDRVVEPNKHKRGTGKDCKHFCNTLEGCKRENGLCRINGKSDHVLNHIRGQLKFNFVCCYCDAYKTPNTQHFKRHFKHFHWSRGFDETQVSREKSTKKSAETVNDSDNGTESDDNGGSDGSDDMESEKDFVDDSEKRKRKKTSPKKAEVDDGNNSGAKKRFLIQYAI